MKELPDRLEPLIIVCGCVESVGLLCSVPQDRGIAVERVQRCRLQSADPTSINNLQSVVSRLDRPRTPGAVGNQVVQVSASLKRGAVTAALIT
jgi:hypothetical protein